MAKLKKYKPTNRDELGALVRLVDPLDDCRENPHYAVNLGDIDVSEMVGLVKIFDDRRTDFSGIETWDVSHVRDFRRLFENTRFDGDISRWDVSNAELMDFMFCDCDFNGDLSRWITSKVTSMHSMFCNSKFNGDISHWDVSSVKCMEYMFAASQFNGDISNWNISAVKEFNAMFVNSQFQGDLRKWNLDPKTQVMIRADPSCFMERDFDQATKCNTPDLH